MDQLNRAYLLGRVLAILIREGATEETALGPQQTYKQALISPAQSIPPLLGVLYAKGKGESLTPLVAKISPNALGGTFSKDEQGAFAVGYAHEMAHVPLPESQDDLDEGDVEAGLNNRWNIRIGTELKEWARSRGGSKLVRRLLEAERARELEEQKPAK